MTGSPGQGSLAFAETVAQAEAVVAADASAVIVAMNPVVDYWRERRGRKDPTIEDLCDERELYPLGDESIDIIESLADRVEALARPLLGRADPHGDLSLRGYFHYLKLNYDGALIRLEQVTRALNTVSPTEVLAFAMPDWRMTGLSSFDKLPWSLTSHMVPAVAKARGLGIRWLASKEATTPSENGIRTRGSAPARGTRWLQALRQWKHRKATRGKISCNSPLLVHSLFGDLGNMIIADWTRRGGQALTVQEFLDAYAVAGDESRVASPCAQLWNAVRGDPECRALLERHGVSLWPYLGPLLEEIVARRLPVDFATSARAQRAFSRHKPVVVSGGMVEANYVIGRAAGRQDVTFVSHHFGGFLGFSLLPSHERYDMAECDYFLCGGTGAEATFAAPSPLARWRAGTRRAEPVPTGLPWVEDLAARSRAAQDPLRPIGRIMVVMNALVGDCRYLGYVFPPEIAYWRFARRVVQRLAREPLEVVVKLPLGERYPQQRSPLEDWLRDHPHPNVRILAGVPLRECLDEADAFVLEGPSTPLLHVAATRAQLLLYADRDVYRLVPRARELLRRRATVFAETQADFFAGLETYLARRSPTVQASDVDDEFLRTFCVGEQPGSLGRIVDFLVRQQAEDDKSAA